MKGNSKKGFTIVELVVTMTISAILIAVAIISIVAYTKYTRFKKLNEYANQLFTASQLQLTYYQEHNNLEDLQAAIEPNLLTYTKITDSEGKNVTATTLWKSEDVDYQSEIHYVIGTKLDYEKYKSNQLDSEKDADLIAMYNIMDTYLYDKTILDCTICVEMDPYEGMVYSVLCTDEDVNFTYGESTSNNINICDRTRDYRYEHMIGYYGADSLSKATKIEIQKPVINNVILHNEGTLNLTFNLSKVTEALQELNYEVIVYDADTKTPKLAIEFNDETLKKTSLDTANYKLIAGDAKNTTRTIIANVRGYNDSTFRNGNYMFPAWIDETGTVHLVLDAVDMGASVSKFNSNSLSETYSLHRFGLSDNNIYCTVQGSGEGYKTTAKRQANTENPYFQKYTEDEDYGTRSFYLSNARHLYNMRFSESKNDSNKKYTYSLTSDFSWKELINNKEVYKSQDTLTNLEGKHWITPENTNNNLFTDDMLKISSTDDLETKAFPSIRALSSNATFSSNSQTKTYTISGLMINKTRNDNESIIIENTDVTGLFLGNAGTIENIALDDVNVLGNTNVGAVCGVNKGHLNDVSVLNSTGNSIVEGKTHIGGITGTIEVPESGTEDYHNLTNRAEVKGYAYLGGIVSDIDVRTNAIIRLSGCRNFGKVYAVKDNTDVITSEFIGGILGYSKSNSKSSLVIDNCNSSPQYKDEDIFTTDGKDIAIEKIGKYVGGIVGYNDGASINKCSTLNENGKASYVIGDKFVGGIAGFNNSLAGSLKGENGYNQANIIGNKYVGGIVGVNAVLDVNENPIETYNSQVELSNWINQGIVAATGNYSGGIAGFNAGIIDTCSCDVTYDNTAQSIINASNTDGDFAGGIAGYNNGKITSTSKLPVVTVISGRNYIGGIVGYNDRGSNCEINNYELNGGYVYGNIFVGGYTGLNTCQSLIESNDKLSANPNVVSGKYCVAGIIGGNIIDANKNLSTAYNTYNILGNITGDSFVGGFIGYNLMTSSSTDIDAATSEIVSNLGGSHEANLAVLNQIVSNSPYVFQIKGYAAELRSIKAKICVGGVIGFNGVKSYLYVNGVTNKTPISATETVKQSEVPNIDNELFSYAGGVTGKVSSTVIIDDCRNEGVGEVSTKGTYIGGIAELNKGLVVNCTAVNLGSSHTDNLGGIVGINYNETNTETFGQNGFIKNIFENKNAYSSDNTIKLGVIDCVFKGTVTGKDNVGGIVALNDGVLYNPKINQGTVTGYGKNIGGVTGRNLILGTITIGKNLDISLSGTGTNVGGVAGYNEGNIKLTSSLINTIESNSSNVLDEVASINTIKSGNNIVGKKNVGGIIGLHKSGNISYLVNNASVVATNGEAGGIIGCSSDFASFIISKCVNKGQVQATKEGNNGGIISTLEEDCIVSNCWNASSITSANGQCGGIASTNNGTIKNCSISTYSQSQGSGVWTSIKNFFSDIWNFIISIFTGEDNGQIVVTGGKNVGAITAVNNQDIINCGISKVKVTNLTNSKDGYSLGGITGTNNGTITEKSNLIEKIAVETYSNKSMVGGVSGLNKGIINGNSTIVGDSNDKVNIGFASDNATVGLFGGVAGKNSGNISGITIYGQIEGNKGNSTTPTNGYGGIAGVNDGNISKCNFNGNVYSNGNSSFIGCVGGITGINNGYIKESIVGTSSNLSTTIQCGSDNSAYGYVGGMVGLNKGSVRNSDNYINSNGNVYIVNYAGHTGGLIGRNGNKSSVSGIKTNVTSTGAKWNVIIQHYDNDCGGGGIMGYSASGENIKYVNNYASVYYNASSSNVSVGGFIGRNENSEKATFTISNCENHGKIMSNVAFNGGFIGTLKYNGVIIDHCKNFAQVGANVNQSVTYNTYKNTKQTVSFTPNANSSTGFVARIYQLSNPTVLGVNDGHNTIAFYSCENYGDMYGKDTGGMLAFIQESDNANMYFSDCVNTGCMYFTSDNAAGIAANMNIGSSIKFYRCRNYGLCKSGGASNFAGIYYGSLKASAIVDCFDCSNATTKPITNCSVSANYIANYYVAKNATSTEGYASAWKTNSLNNLFVIGDVDGSSLVQSDYPLTNCYDGNTQIGTTADTDYSARLTVPSSNFDNKPSFIFTPKTTGTITDFSICWGNNGNDTVYRKYMYNVYYQLDNSDQWIKVTDESKSNYETQRYDEDNKYYVAYGYPSTFNSDYSTYRVPISSNAGEKVAKIRVQIDSVKSGDSKAGATSGTQYVVIGEAYMFNNGNKVDIGNVSVVRDNFKVDATNNLRNTYDNSTSTKLAITNDAAATAQYTENSKSTTELIYDMATPSNFSKIGICWGANSSIETRRYTYKLYYQIKGSESWTQVTSSSSGTNGISFNSTNKCYVATATLSNVTGSTYYHNLDTLNTSDKVTKIKVKIISSATKTSKSYSLNAVSYTNEVMVVNDEVTNKVSANSSYTVNVGLPLAATGSAGNYSLVSTDGLKLSNVTQSPKNGYDTDYSSVENESNSNRYKLYNTIEDAVSKYFSVKYGNYLGTIKVGTPEDEGNCSYHFTWTSTVTPMEYEVSYTITDSAGNVILPCGGIDNTIRSKEKEATISIPSAYVGYNVTFNVRNVGLELTESGTYTEVYSPWANGTTIKVKEPLPTPQIRLELVKTGTSTYRYKVVLDNESDYSKYTPNTDSINVNGPYYTTSFMAGNKESDATINITSTANNTITYQAVDTSGTYGNSAYRTVQTKMFSPTLLNSTDYAKTYFDEYFGSTLGSLYYTMRVEQRNSPETYYFLELVSQDKEIGCDVVESYSESHVTENGYTLTATLSNLPEDLIQSMVEDNTKTVTVRTYPWRTQAYMSYFGHTIGENLSIEELKKLDIFNGTQIKDGYVIQKNTDDTYNVIYSVILGNSNYFATQIDKAIYQVVNENGVDYVTSTTNNYKVPIQPTPVIESSYDHVASKNSYTFYWDKDKKYTDANYNVTLMGIAKDGTEVELDNTTTNKNNVTYIDDNWNYPNFDLKIERIGKEDENGVTIFPSKSNKVFNLKIRLDQITAPTVALHVNDNSIIEKDELMYDVSWDGISNDELDYYEIKVKYEDTSNNVTEILFNTGDTEGHIYKNSVDTGNIAQFVSSGKTSTNAVINLNSLADYGGNDIDISIKAIAKEDASTYRNGLEGVVRTITLPTRLDTPLLNNLTCDAKDVATIKDFTDKGLTFTMNQDYVDKGNYEMVVEIVDENHDHVADVLYNNKVVSKTNPIEMSGNLILGTYNLTGISTKYAGMYLKVSMRAVSDSNISSVWSDSDGSVLAYKYFRLQKVRIDTPEVSEGVSKILYTGGSEKPIDWNYFDQTDLEFSPVEYANEYNILVLGKLEGDNVLGTSYKKSPLYNLRLIKEKNGFKVMMKIPDSIEKIEETTSTQEETTEIPSTTAVITEETTTEEVTTESSNSNITDYEKNFKEETLLGTIKKGEELSIPYYGNIFITENEGITSIEVNGFIKYRDDGKIVLVLPDTAEVDLKKTENIIINADATDQINYVNSQFVTWYRDVVNKKDVTVIKGFEDLQDPPTLTVNDFVVSSTTRKDYSYNMTFNSNYRTIIEVSGDTDDDMVDDFVKTYSVPGYEMTTNIQSLLLLNDQNFAQFKGKSLRVRVRYVVNNFGISKWSNQVIVNLP